MLLFRPAVGTGIARWSNKVSRHVATFCIAKRIVNPCCQTLFSRTLLNVSANGKTERTDFRKSVTPSKLSTNSFSTTALYNGVTVTGHSISSRLSADRLIREMTEKERQYLEQALNDLQQELDLENEHAGEAKPTPRQLWLMALNNSIPFIGFGFLDNAIMIAAGEYIDMTVGTTLGITTMAAAGIGNMISDVFGIGLAGYVEVLAARLGIPEANLTAVQLTMKSTRMASYGGRAMGIIFGCFIGMFPLLFIESHDHEDGESKEEPAPA